MPLPTRIALAMIGVLTVLNLAGCGADAEKVAASPGLEGASVKLAANTCWTAATLGADPQAVLELSKTFAVDYFATAHAVDSRPAFQRTQACADPHHVEVFRIVPVDQVTPKVTSYASFLKYGRPGYTKLVAAVERACMTKPLAARARQTQVPGAIVAPALPEGLALGWAPPSPDQWSRGQRVYACTLTSSRPVQFRYAAVFTKAFPTDLRTCISNAPLMFVDCARKHQRERLMVIDVRTAVAAKKFPGPQAITTGAQGRIVDVPASRLVALDRACTSYLRAYSSTTRLSGVAVIDADRWPAPDGTFPIYCEADSPPTQSSITTQGSVFDQ